VLIFENVRYATLNGYLKEKRDTQAKRLWSDIPYSLSYSLLYIIKIALETGTTRNRVKSDQRDLASVSRFMSRESV